jgi:hypothetical protein
MFGNLFSSSPADGDKKKDLVQELIDSHWPTIEATIVPFLIKVTEDHLNDDQHTTSIFENAHAVLPLPIRLAIRQGTFVSYCHEHRSTLIQKINEYKDRQTKTIAKQEAGEDIRQIPTQD